MKSSGLIVCCLFIGALVCTCGRSPLAGGTSDTGNARVAAMVFTKSGGRAIGASVVMCPKTYTAGAQNDSIAAGYSSIKRTVTDDSGCFFFDSVDDGDYFIEINDRASCALLLQADLSRPSIRSIYFNDTLHPYAGIEGNAGRQSSQSSGRRYLAVYGIERRIPIDSSGNFTCTDLPRGAYRFRIISSDPGFLPVDIDSIAMFSGAIVSAPFVGWKRHVRLVLNTSSSGAGIKESVYGFPILVRLTSVYFNFNETQVGGEDCRFAKTDNTPLAFEVERWDAAGGLAEIWVKVDTILGNNKSQSILFYWGNPNAAHISHDNAVFDTAEGFQGVWHLSDGSIDSAKDATSNHFHGTAYGMDDASITEGMIGRARTFDGVSTHISILNTASGKLNFPQDGYYSVSAWVNLKTTDSASQVIVSKGDEQYFLCCASFRSYFCQWEFVEFEDKTGWQISKCPAEGNTWALVTGVKNGNMQYFYVNGDLADSTPRLLSDVRPRVETFDVAIGKFMETKAGDGEGFFNGIIDEVRISSVSLSADWARLCYMNQRPDDRLVRFQW